MHFHAEDFDVFCWIFKPQTWWVNIGIVFWDLQAQLYTTGLSLLRLLYGMHMIRLLSTLYIYVYIHVYIPYDKPIKFYLIWCIYVCIYIYTHLQATNTIPAVDQERRWINLSGACQSEPTGCETRVPVAHRRPPGCGSVIQNWRGRTWNLGHKKWRKQGGEVWVFSSWLLLFFFNLPYHSYGKVGLEPLWILICTINHREPSSL